MNRLLAIMCSVVTVAVAAAVVWSGSPGNEAAPDTDADTMRRAAAWRALGPAGLASVLQLEPVSDDPATREPPPAVVQWRALVDAVAGQHDAWASKLYWYTDLEEAKAAAAESGRPILSLRLLGRLTDEFSCANSRFFRKTLYPDEAVSAYLRDGFILHWESVRPVPIVTIDFGDGRTLRRTITGNSVHLVIDAQGRLVDALPGLYGPEAFLAALRPAHATAVACGLLADPARRAYLTTYHAQRQADVEKRLDDDLRRAGIPGDEADRFKSMLATATQSASTQPLNQRDSGPRNARKNRDMFQAHSLPDRSLRVWEILATFHEEQIRSNSAVMRVAAPGVRPANRANPLAVTKSTAESRLVDNVVLNEFTGDRALDTVFNEYALHRKIHRQLHGTLLLNRPLGEFTEWCYADVFLSPLDDPWYGLKPEVFDGYDDGPLAAETADTNLQVSRTDSVR